MFPAKEEIQVDETRLLSKTIRIIILTNNWLYRLLQVIIFLLYSQFD